VGPATLEIEIGKLAKQADGAAVVRYGDTVVLATPSSRRSRKETRTSFP
jgi:polyribonucleotide nucleotidyltransferase